MDTEMFLLKSCRQSPIDLKPYHGFLIMYIYKILFHFEPDDKYSRES